MIKIFLIHGFNVWDGGIQTVGRLRPYLEVGHHCVEQVSYGYVNVARLRAKNLRWARHLVDIVPEGSIGVGHSNGCAILYTASQLGARFDQLVYINPALEVHLVPGSQVRWCHVWHSPSDVPVRMAKYWRVIMKASPLGLLFGGHPWGEMGAIGYQGNDTRMLNYNKEKNYSRRSSSHSDMFSDDLLPFYAAHILNEIEKRENKRRR